jgi:dipeptidyl-peptidase 4
VSADPRFLRDFAETRAFTLGRPARPQLTPDGSAVLFLRSPARSPEHRLFQMDVASGQVTQLVAGEELVGPGGEAALSAEEQARRERQRITDSGITGFQLSPDGAQVLVPYAGRLFLVARSGGAIRPVTDAGAPPPLDARFSPDGTRIAFVREGDLHVIELDASSGIPEARALTTGATADRFRGLAEFVAQEEMARHEGFWWSPAGDRLLFAEVDQSDVEQFSIADPARPEREPLRFRYPRPGLPNARVRLGLLDAAPAGADTPATWLSWDHERYPYVARVLWDTTRAPLAVLVQTRDQRQVALLAVDVVTGDTRPLVEEGDPDWVNLDRDLPRWLPDGSGLLWASEAGGAIGHRQLQLRDPTGALVRPLLGTEQQFQALVHVSPDARSLIFLAGDPVHNRLVRLDLASGACAPLAPEAPAEHTPVFARSGQRWVDTVVRHDAMPESRVVSLGGPGPVLPSVAEDPPVRVNLQLTETASNGDQPSFRAAIIRPTDFQQGRRYPVVLHVYGGPHHLSVKADARVFAFDQWLAEHGCIVVALDNRGTPRRGRAWERAIKGQLGEVPLADQVAGLQALGRQHPELDLERVGVYGWSFGGYLSALAVLRRPDVFKVAVAGAPVVDWRDYDTHYTERYLDRPETESAAYDHASLLSHAGGLSRPLLIIHGTADDNVYFFHSLKLVDALFRAGKRFDFLPLPRVTHQIADPLVREQLWGQVARYLMESLRAARSLD